MNISLGQQLGMRGELLAREFLIDLGASFVGSLSEKIGFDYIAVFPEKDGGSRLVAIETKATDREIGHSFQFDSKQLLRLSRTNVPTLVVIADVKHNVIHFAWAKESAEKFEEGVLTSRPTIKLPLTQATPENMTALRTIIANT